MKQSRSARYFQRMVYAVLCLFGGTMLLVTTIAYMRRSGNTGLDMAKIHLIRQAAVNPQAIHSDEPKR